MKHCLVIIAAAAATSLLAAPAPRAASTIFANASLKDGSTIRGEFRTERIHGSTAFLDKLDLDPGIIKSVTFDGTNGESKVELANGDKFAMTIANESFAIKSLLGDLDIPRANFRSLALSARNLAAGGTEDGLVFYCTFDDEEATEHPAIGNAMVRLLNADFQQGKDGGAMKVQRGLPAVEISFLPGTFGDKGCIEFWANFLDGKTEFSTGGDPRFFTLYKKSGNEFGTFEYASNSGNGNKGLCASLPAGFTSTHSGFTGMMPYSDIFHGRPYEGWHHYALVWNVHGINSEDFRGARTIAIYIDGKSVGSVYTQGHPEAMPPLSDLKTVLGIPMRESGPSYNNKSSYLMDDLKIWNHDKTDFSL